QTASRCTGVRTLLLLPHTRQGGRDKDAHTISRERERKREREKGTVREREREREGERGSQREREKGRERERERVDGLKVSFTECAGRWCFLPSTENHLDRGHTQTRACSHTLTHSHIHTQASARGRARSERWNVLRGLRGLEEPESRRSIKPTAPRHLFLQTAGSERTPHVGRGVPLAHRPGLLQLLLGPG
ncbi:hypothetical protein COCON_G00046240, partial [Conger conger]